MVDEIKTGKCVCMSECECVSKYVSICMNACKHGNIRMKIYVHVYVYKCTYVQAYKYVLCIHIGMFMYKYISTRMYVHACTTLKLCACVFEHM